MTQRFTRTESKWKHITKRDLEIVKFVYHGRYATRLQVQGMFFTPSTETSCKRRLRVLFNRGYLRKRPTAPTSPDIYYLGLRGRRWVSSELGVNQDYADSVAGVKGRGDTFLTHDLALTDIYAHLLLQCRRAGLELTWKNTRMLELEKLGVQPDGWLEVGRNGRSKQAYIEYTRVPPTKEELVRKLEGYSRLRVSVLWFCQTQSVALRIASSVQSWDIAPYILTTCYDSSTPWLNAPVWNGVDGIVSFIRLSNQNERAKPSDLPLVRVPIQRGM